jgi:hypothetical protein
MGVATANISNGVNGTVMSFGTLKNIDTRGNVASAIAVGDETWAAGDILFAHPTVDGKLTKVRPQHDLVVAFITVRNATAGQLAVRITSGNHLEWLHDVEIEDPADDQILAYDETAGIWKNIDIPESAAVISSATAPENTSAIWFNTETGVTYIYYDNFWTSIAGSSGAPIISDTAPTDPVLGTQWFNSSTGKSYLYYSNAWVEIDSNGTSAQPSGNAIINGAFEINQRGFTSGTGGGYGFDRWAYAPSGGTGTYSAETFTPGAAPVAGYEAKNFSRLAITTGNDLARMQQLIESVRTFAGQTATVSFWAKGTNPTTAGNLAVSFFQNFGTGGSPSSEVALTQQTFVLTGSWTRYSFTFEIPSISGKTIGTNNNDYLLLSIGQGTSTSTDAWTLDLWGVQLEAGAVATPFKRNAPSIQAELAACQRYYYRATFQGSVSRLGNGFATANTNGQIAFSFPVQMRTNPTALDQSGTPGDYSVVVNTGSAVCNAVPSFFAATVNAAVCDFPVTGGLTGGQAVMLRNVNTNAFLGWSAEL